MFSFNDVVHLLHESEELLSIPKFGFDYFPLLVFQTRLITRR